MNIDRMPVIKQILNEYPDIQLLNDETSDYTNTHFAYMSNEYENITRVIDNYQFLYEDPKNLDNAYLDEVFFMGRMPDHVKGGTFHKCNFSRAFMETNWEDCVFANCRFVDTSFAPDKHHLLNNSFTSCVLMNSGTPFREFADILPDDEPDAKPTIINDCDFLMDTQADIRNFSRDENGHISGSRMTLSLSSLFTR